jgi:3-hydroxybutyryl-CoA dehydrogenase
MAKNLRFEDLESPLIAKRKSDDRFRSVGIIGLGVMGTGIAETVAGAGIDVIGLEKDEEHLKVALGRLNREMDREIKRWGKTASEKRAVLARIRGTVSFADLKECDIVIEAVDEKYDLKRSILEQFTAVAKKDAVFISNSATISLTKLAQTSPRPERIIGMHFLHPVPHVPLVELVRGLKTSDETFGFTQAFARRIGKTPVEVFEYPGFITTRTILPMLNEAMHVLMEGIAKAEDIDTALRLGYNMQIGPLEMADAMGLDEVLTWMETLWHELGETRFRPCPLLRRMVREGHLGKKTGEGFFTYNEDGQRQ